MQYATVIPAVFCSRPNRFIAEVQIGTTRELVHVKNTGRCKELLVPGCRVYLSAARNPNRKTKYDLIAVEKARNGMPPLLINMDAQIPNDAAEEWLKSGALFPADAEIRREVTHGNSRFDFAITHHGTTHFLEVKGVTLERDGLVLFPDAPTVRGVKHIRELISCVQEGYGAWLLFVIQMKGAAAFMPNDTMQPEFGAALRDAEKAGVHLLAMDCRVTPDTVALDQPVPVYLEFPQRNS